MDNKPSMVKSAVMMGLVIGFLSGLPYLSIVNLCTCCLAVALCGFLAAMLYSKECKAVAAEFGPGQGALVGLIAGVVYGVVAGLVDGIVTLAFGDLGSRQFLEWIREIEGIPPESQDMIDDALDQLDEGGVGAIQFVWGIFTAIVVGAIWSTVGGLIGGAVFKSKPEPPAPPALGGDPFGGSSGGTGSAGPPPVSS